MKKPKVGQFYKDVSEFGKGAIWLVSLVEPLSYDDDDDYITDTLYTLICVFGGKKDCSGMRSFTVGTTYTRPCENIERIFDTDRDDFKRLKKVHKCSKHIGG